MRGYNGRRRLLGLGYCRAGTFPNRIDPWERNSNRGLSLPIEDIRAGIISQDRTPFLIYDGVISNIQSPAGVS
jgi:hypothetical protein